MTNWEKIGAFLLLASAVLTLIVLCATKKVDGYYLSQGGDKKAVSSCVYAHWTWHPDEIAFCSDDYNKTLDFAAKANAIVRSSK